jgi:hypothetical protein
MHGPSSSLTSPWAEYPIVPVVDSVMGALPRGCRRAWRRARDRALSLWSVAGPAFVVTRGGPDAPKYDATDPDYPQWNPDFDPDDPSTWHMVGDEDAFMRGLLVPGAMHLLTMPEGWIGTTTPGVGWTFDTGSFAIWSRDYLINPTGQYGERPYIVCHEIGHALGLGHSTQKTSVMYTVGGVSSRPDAHDLKSLVDFYS